MSIENEILRLTRAKSQLKNSLIRKAISVSDTDRIDTYPNYVSTINTYRNNYFEAISANLEHTAYLETAEVLEGLTELRSYAFYNRGRIVNVTLPEDLVLIGTHAFDGCTSLTTITLPSNLVTLSDYMFKDCTSLTTITIPNSVKTIGRYVFSDCTSLTTITIPNSVETIGGGAFYVCTSLTEIIVDNSEGAISGAPWGAPNATVTYLR